MSNPYISTEKIVNLLKPLLTKISLSTQTVAGLMSASDKAKIDSYPDKPNFASEDHLHEGYSLNGHSHTEYAIVPSKFEPFTLARMNHIDSISPRYGFVYIEVSQDSSFSFDSRIKFPEGVSIHIVIRAMDDICVTIPNSGKYQSDVDVVELIQLDILEINAIAIDGQIYLRTSTYRQ